MSTPRFEHAAIVLPSGEVLVVGGSNGFDGASHLDSAEIYDPRDSSWRTIDSMSRLEGPVNAKLLNDGRVLVIGSHDSEIYDPRIDLWVDVIPLATPAGRVPATQLRDGRVLVAGGFAETDTVTAYSQIFDPTLGTWSILGTLLENRAYHSAAELPDGRVLVAGGEPPNKTAVELLDTSTGAVVAAAPMRLPHAYCQGTSVLSDGRVLVTGGEGFDPPGPISRETPAPLLASVEAYDPVTGTWQELASMSAVRCGHAQIALDSDRVLVSGGWREGIAATVSAEILDPRTGKWTSAESMGSCRQGHVAVKLTAGRIFVVGGVGHDGPLASAEIFDPEA